MGTSFILQRTEVSTLEEGKDEDSESDQEVISFHLAAEELNGQCCNIY